MTIIQGSLSEFSLPEIFQLLDQGQKTGILTVRDSQNLQSGKPSLRHIWLHSGRVVAAGDCLDNRGLARLIEQKGYITESSRPELERFVQENVLLGLNLKSLGILQPDQLKLLFGIQVLRQVCALFNVEVGQFRFSPISQLPKAEMTGLSLPATETTLMGLRSLKDWKGLENKLPEPSSTLFKIGSEPPHLRLDTSETQVWELADCSINLVKIAEQLHISIQKAQQIAFRLIVVGLVEEVPDIDGGIANKINNPDQEKESSAEVSCQVISSSERSEVSGSFLQSLVGFLRHSYNSTSD